MALYPILRPLLFRLEAERAHGLVARGVGLASRLPGFLPVERALYGNDDPLLGVELWGLNFPNPVGLAAGYDKDGRLVRALSGLGFGFVEVGTVTPRPQPGNVRPRLFRLPEDEALINRMGFNNRGALHLADRLARKGGKAGIVGVNLGKNLDTPVDEAAADYLTALHALYPVADYIVINISSPNTPGLRKLQEKPALREITQLLCRERDKLAEAAGRRAPFLVKIAPDMSRGQLADVVEVALEVGVDGLIAANTTTRREGLAGAHREEQGGLSGRPLHAEALRTVTELHGLTGGKLPIIGVGGIFGAEEAYAFIRAGASLIQIFTGLIYKGPSLPRLIKRGLAELLKRDGMSSIGEAVGSANPKKRGRGAQSKPRSSRKKKQ